MDTYGFLQQDRHFSLMAHAATGFLPIAAGHGFPIITGDGALSTMEDGLMTVPLAGTGYLVINGLLHGLAGEVLRVIMAGAR